MNYKKSFWLSNLTEIEMILPQLLKDQSIWNSVFVDYEEPYVERLWTHYGDSRIYLHKIHPPTKSSALFHPHPWPSAMRIIQGSYRMDVGYGTGSHPPPIAATIILPAGSTYEMSDPDGWHSVEPIHEPTYTLMITGNPWKRESPKSSYKLQELSKEAREHLFEVFKKYYQ